MLAVLAGDLARAEAISNELDTADATEGLFVALTGYCVMLLRIATRDNRDDMVQWCSDQILKAQVDLATGLET